MRVLLTVIGVLTIGIVFGQTPVENQSSYEYGVSLSVGNLTVNSFYFNEKFHYLNLGTEISMHKAMTKRVKLVYGFSVNKLIYKSGPTSNQQSPAFCFGEKCSTGSAEEKPVFYQKEVYFFGLKLGVIHSIFNQGKFKSYAMSNVQIFYNDNLEIHNTIFPGLYMYVNGGLGATYKIAKRVQLGINFEAGMNQGSFWGNKSDGMRLLNYQTNVSFLFQL